MTGDRETLDFYSARAADYAALEVPGEALDMLERFMAGLPEGAAVLDLGCGHGWAAAILAERGFAVDATDGAPGMVEEARRLTGLPVRVMRFDELDAVEAYDGVWASFSLLHAPLAAAPAHLRRVHRSLRPGGALLVGVKAAAEGPSSERRDSLGRFYAYYARADLETALRDAGFRVDWVVEGSGVGMEGKAEPHFNALARKRV